MNSGYLVLSENGQYGRILCTDGEFHSKSLVGPGGWRAKIYKTKENAEKHNPGRVVVALESYSKDAK